MSLQVFLQAQLLGTDQFFSSETAGNGDETNEVTGRGAWLTLLGEVLPRALLAELKLSRMLLGSSSAEQFLLVLPEEEIPRANAFLADAAHALATLSANELRLVWATTENLGAWPVVRKRLDDALASAVCCPVEGDAAQVAGFFAPFQQADNADRNSVRFSFAAFAEGMVSANSVGWSAAEPALLAWDRGVHTWSLREHSAPEEEAILFPRRLAMNSDGSGPAPLHEIAERSEGADRWGILRGDVDHFEVQLRRAATVEEHIHLSALFKEFFAGELAVLCALPEFWRKVTVLYRGGDDFTVAGSWDALILLARELQRVFDKFAEQHLAALPGVEGKSATMAVVIAPDADSPISATLAESSLELRAAKSAELGSLSLFGRSLEPKRLGDAEELKAGLVRLVRDFRFPSVFLNDLAAVYRESGQQRAGRRTRGARVEKPWKTYLRLTRIIPMGRNKEQNGVRNAVINNLAGKRSAGQKLRPAARAGLEWARLETGA